MRVLLLTFLLFLGTQTYAQKGTIVMPDGHSLLINLVKSDAQGRYIYSAEQHKCIMWDRKNGRQLYSFNYNSEDYASGLDVSPDGKMLAVCAGGNLQLFSTLDGKRLGSKIGFSSQTDVAFSADGNEIYSYYQGVHVLDSKTLFEKSSIKSEGSNSKIWLLLDGRVLAARSGAAEIYDVKKGQVTYSFKFPIEGGMTQIGFLPAKQLLISYGKSKTMVDFYDISKGLKVGSVKADYYDVTVIPSINTNEVFITGPEMTEGFYAMDLYNADDFSLKSRHSGTGVVKYHPTNGGFFDGEKKRSWFIGYNKISEYNIATTSITRILEGVTANLGMDTFNAIDFNDATGKLNITTDDSNLKTVDLFRMIPVLHSVMKKTPDGVAVSATGDTAALFNGGSVQIKNLRQNRILRMASTGGAAGFLYRNAFFFSNDGKKFYYPVELKDGVSIYRMNSATGVSSALFKVSGFGPLTVHPDKTLLAGFESSYQVNVASVWDLNTGKRVFSHQCEADGEYDSQFIQVSKDKKSVLVVTSSQLNVYDLASGAQISEKNFQGGIDKFGSSGASSDLTLFATGTQFGGLAVFDQKGSQLYHIQAHDNAIRKIFFSANGKIFYTVSYDNTIKVWEASTGKNFGVLYLFKDTNDYVFMDGEGRFDGSPDGIKKIYYVLNQEATTLDAIFETYYAPGLYARSVAGEHFPPITIENLLPAPKVKISYAAVSRNLEVEEDKPTYQNTTGTAEISILAENEGAEVDEIRLFHNGKIVTLTSRNMFVAEDGSKSALTRKYVVSLLPGENHLKAIALNNQRTESKPDEIVVKYNPSNKPPVTNPINQVAGVKIDPVDKSAVLHLLVIGINKYQNPAMSLNYALADATAFKSEIEKDAKTVISEVKTHFVTDELANKEGIEVALKQIRQAAKPSDLFIFYYAGHGVIGKDKEFYLIPNDVSDLKNVQAELVQKGLPAKLLQNYAIDIAAQKQLFILDACQSAGAFNELLSANGDQQKSIAVVSRSTGTHWMAASGAQQYANEFSQLGHGAFTYILLEALKGAAASNKMVTVNGLKNYVQEEVPALMKKYSGTLQYPASYGFGNDFPVALLK